MDNRPMRASRVEDAVNENDPTFLQKSPPGFTSGPAGKPASRKLSLLAETPQWKDWHWQLRNRIRSFARLVEFFPSFEIDPDKARAISKFPMAITPYYASLIEKFDPSDPIFAMSVPQGQELWNPPFLRDDPLEEDRDMPVPGLVHRYQDRALFIVTSACAMYCRHCTRKRLTGERESRVSASRLKRTVEYLQKHPEIRDVVVSGGDPLTMSTGEVENIVSALRSVPSLDIIRIGTRVPVTLPHRVTDELVGMLKNYHPVWINTQFNHPCEITTASAEACARLVDAGIPLGNQSVLLKGINDDPLIVEHLLRGLVRMRVRPYYMFQCDLVPGVEHFRTPLSRGIEIMEYLRGRLSGIAIPTFAVDLPHGGGKVPLLPDYVVSRSPSHTVLRNFEGMFVNYPEPYAEEPAASGLRPQNSPNVADLARGHASKIQPQNTERHLRRQLHGGRTE
jgi:lysine 2,3-aminomutase